MTITENPKTQENIEKNTSKIEEVKVQLENATTAADALLQIYKEGQSKVKKLGETHEGIQIGPWKNLNDGGVGASNNNIFVFIQAPPMSNVYNNTSEIIKKNNLVTSGPKTKNYFELFTTYAVSIANILKPQLTETKTQLAAANVAKFQQTLIDVTKLLLEEHSIGVQIIKEIITITNSEINKTDSIIYKGELAYGPFSTTEIALFTLPQDLLDILPICNKAIDLIRDLIVKLDTLLNVSEDILKRAILSNAGLTQNTDDPNTFNTVSVEEKDPWGIRFSYVKSITGQVYEQEQQVIRGNSTLTEDQEKGNIKTATKEDFLIENNPQLLNNTIQQKRNFYFQLLPAIKSNLPVSGGTDVPGAMPGIQFRIENNIVKHKIPGFAPIYQPIGIDSIKCTLVGMFSGNDGVDISSAYSDDISAGLLLDGKELTSSLKTGTNLEQSTGNTSNPNFDKVGTDSSGLPIPSTYKSTTSSNVAVLSEDAFKGAQDFYNEIVLSGREVEIELNLRKSSGALEGGGGSPGPFRDPETGNPKFNGLIKRLDLYYVRRDRCWFIIDLEITNSGLIGTECINLTNIIEEATELFESVVVQEELTRAELDACFTNPVTFNYKKEKAGLALVVDMNSGLSYEYFIADDSLNKGTYPTSLLNTLNIIGTQYDQLTLTSKSFGAHKKTTTFNYLIDIIITATVEIKGQTEIKGFTWATNKIPIKGKGGFARYNKNNKLFYRTDSKGNIKDKNPLGNLKSIFSLIHYREASDSQEGIDFLLNEYLSLVTPKKEFCTTESVKKEGTDIDTVTNETKSKTPFLDQNSIQQEDVDTNEVPIKEETGMTFTVSSKTSTVLDTNPLVSFTEEEQKIKIAKIATSYAFVNTEFIKYLQILANQETENRKNLHFRVEQFYQSVRESSLRIVGLENISLQDYIRIKPGSLTASAINLDYINISAQIEILKPPIKVITSKGEQALNPNIHTISCKAYTTTSSVYLITDYQFNGL